MVGSCLSHNVDLSQRWQQTWYARGTPEQIPDPMTRSDGEVLQGAFSSCIHFRISCSVRLRLLLMISMLYLWVLINPEVTPNLGLAIQARLGRPLPPQRICFSPANWTLSCLLFWTLAQQIYMKDKQQQNMDAQLYNYLKSKRKQQWKNQGIQSPWNNNLSLWLLLMRHQYRPPRRELFHLRQAKKKQNLLCGAKRHSWMASNPSPDPRWSLPQLLFTVFLL